jgi:competence protein ComEC
MRTVTIQQAPAFRLALLLIIGIIAGNTFPGIVPWFWIAVTLLSVGTVLLAVGLRRNGERSQLSLVVATAVCIAAGTTKGIVDRQRDDGLQDSTVTGKFFVVGRIGDPPTTVERRTRFTLDVESIRGGTRWLWVRENAATTLIRTRKDSVSTRLEYGMRVLLYGELGRPAAERNPGEFSPRSYYQANGISLALFVRGYGNVCVLDTTGGTWLMREVVVPARRSVLAGIDQTVGGEAGEFLKGLLIGERSGIPVTTRQAFVNAGVAHVLAVSGSNVAVVAAVLVLVLGFARLPRWLNAIAVAGGLLFYMMITGNQPPVVRATIMALVVLFGKLVQRHTNAYNTLGISALMILAIDSRQLYDVGFQLSFGAVLSIVYLYPRINTWLSRLASSTGLPRALLWLLRLCAVSLAATLGTLPLTALSFGRVSIIGILANIVVIPATSLSVVLGCITSVVGVLSPWLGSMYAGVNSIVLRGTLAITELSGGLSFAYIDTLRFRPIDALPFYALLFFCVYLGRPTIARRLLILLSFGLNLSVFWPAAEVAIRRPGMLRVSVIDVGEGDAVLVEFPRGETMLVDAGPRTGTYDAGAEVVVPFLKRRGISRIDFLVLTHPHSDHIGGVCSVLKHCDVRRVVDSGQPERSSLYTEYLNAVRFLCPRHETIQKGDMLGVTSLARVYVLSPVPDLLSYDTSDQKANLNNTSVVLKMVYGSMSFLLVGDAERTAEDGMVSAYDNFLASGFLKAGHHGSSTSSSEVFVASVNPSYVVISVGKNNKFRHPSPSVVRRFDASEAELMRTDDDGAIIIESDGQTLVPIRWH